MTEHVILWLLGVGITVSIAAYFRYGLKPRIEVIFERNLKLTLELLFSKINIFDSVFIDFCDYAQKKINPLPKDGIRYVNLDLPNNEGIHIIPNIKDYPEIEANRTRFDYGNKVLKEFLKMAINDKKNIYEQHLKDNKYSDDSFTWWISVYLLCSVNFMQGITENYSYRSFLDRRLKYAKLIITILKEDKLIPKRGSIREFVDKWEKYIESEKNNAYV